MATESLIVELDAKTTKLDSKLKKTELRLNKLEGSAKNTSSSFSKLSKTASVVSTSILAVGAVAATATAAIIGLSKVVGEYAKELKVASDLSGVAVEELQLMAHATSTVGIGIEQLGDISKDTREKIGDFLNTGGGGFDDFVRAMKLTKTEANAVANEFAVLSGPQILQEMVTRMEAANVSAVQMSHALEGMASDTTKLIPLMKDGGASMIALKLAAASVIIPLDNDDVDLFIRMGQSTDIAASALKSLGEQTLLDLSSAFIRTANSAAQFFASLNEGTIAQKSSRINDISDEIDTLEEGIKNAETAAGRAWNVLTFNTGQEKFSLEKINELLVEKWRLQSEIDVIEKGRKPDIIPDDLDKPQTGTGSVDEIQAIEDRFKDEEQLLADKLERELEMVGKNKELRLELDNEYWMNVVELEIAAEEEKAAREEAALNKATKLKEKAARYEMAIAKAVANNAMALAKMVLGDSKAAAIAGIVIQKALALSANSVATAAGATAAFAAQQVPGDPTSFARGTAAAAAVETMGAVNAGLIIATGLGEAAGAMSGGSGGGSISGDSSSAPAQQSDFQPETSSLELTDSSDSGSQQNTINFGTDSGDDLIDAIASALNKAQIEGRA